MKFRELRRANESLIFCWRADWKLDDMKQGKSRTNRLVDDYREFGQPILLTSLLVRIKASWTRRSMPESRPNQRRETFDILKNIQFELHERNHVPSFIFTSFKLIVAREK